MLFKALNNREKEKAERSYIYSYTTKHLNFTVKSKRSQSALEYMMTYGWAILIIVIVAVILYSMGIFNPSSSVTFTSSGFSPFTVSSSLCNNLGYKIAIISGPIPNNANYITINKVFVTSATGANTTTASYTLTNPVTLKSGQSATILIPNVACNSANTHYSLSAKIQYSYTASTLGLQTINTTGTVAGTSISGKPSVLTTYEPITITNTQSSATPSPFQQMVNFTSSDPGFSSIATGNFGQNVEFFYYNGTVIPSWLENYTSTNAIWWLKIAAIPSGSSETIYVGFAPTSTNLFNTVNDGEAPQLSCPNPSDTASCSTYAEYDDGVNVFNEYANFNGVNDGDVTNSQYSVINNGVVFSSDTGVGGQGVGITVFNKIYFNQTLVFYGAFFNGATDITTDTGMLFLHFGAEPSLNDYNSTILTLTAFPPNNNTNYPTNGQWFIFSEGAINNTNKTGYTKKNFGDAYTVNFPLNNPAYSLDNNIGPVSFYTQQSSLSNLSIKYVMVLNAPPNGVMPSVTFGSIA